MQVSELVAECKARIDSGEFCAEDELIVKRAKELEALRKAIGSLDACCKKGAEVSIWRNTAGEIVLHVDYGADVFRTYYGGSVQEAAEKAAQQENASDN
jgi:hypothetical protein